MSFDSTQFSVLAYANGFTHWHYRTPDALDRVLTPAYFAAAAEMLRPGDQITLNVQRDGNLGLAHLVVSGSAGEQPAVALVAASPMPAQTMLQAA